VTDPQEPMIRAILGYTRRIAVVGLSDSPLRTSYQVAADLQARGYDIVPVNPRIESSLGVPAVASLAEVDGDIDLVNVFRRAEHLPDVARQAAACGARGLWNQLGLRSEEARAIAADAGLDYVEDRCLKVEVARNAATPA
jgi:uncharacterized protein